MFKERKIKISIIKKIINKITIHLEKKSYF